MSDLFLCPLCNSPDTQLFLVRNKVPVQQNCLNPTREAALNMPRGNLHMCICTVCGFVFNSAFDPSIMSYNADYNNAQESSELFRQYLLTLKDKLVRQAGLKQSNIVEIGCGKGFFLKLLVLDESLDNRGVGFDPAYEGEETIADGRLRFEKKYFDSNCRVFEADVLICRHVIEHIYRPIDFIRGIGEALKGSQDCRLYFETPCVDWAFENLTIWDFFYEHCSLFSAESISILFNQCGYELKNLDYVFGGQYLWVEAVKVARPVAVGQYRGNTLEKMKKFAELEKKVVAHWVEAVQKLRKIGPVAVWGSGAKGVTFVNLIDRNCDLIDLVIDVSPEKQNKYVPGTGHKVVGLQQIAGAGIKNVIVMNPNYVEEIRAMLSKSELDIKLIVEPGDA